MWKKAISKIDIFFYIILAIVLIWAVLKSLGIIQSPMLIEMVPVFGIVFGAGAIYMKINIIDKRVEKMDDTVRNIDTRTVRLEENVALREKTLTKMDDRLVTLENPRRRK